MFVNLISSAVERTVNGATLDVSSIPSHKSTFCFQSESIAKELTILSINGECSLEDHLLLNNYNMYIPKIVLACATTMGILVAQPYLQVHEKTLPAHNNINSTSPSERTGGFRQLQQLLRSQTTRRLCFKATPSMDQGCQAFKNKTLDKWQFLHYMLFSSNLNSQIISIGCGMVQSWYSLMIVFSAWRSTTNCKQWAIFSFSFISFKKVIL